VRISGICTNISLLKRILADGVFRDGIYDTNFLPEFLARVDANALIKQINDAAGKSGAGIDRNAIKIDGSDELKVLSPSTGIFYITPTPTEPEFVAVGDRIRVNDTLCQLEAMKIFTPLALKDFNSGDQELYPSAQRYEVTRINNTSGQQVNVGDLLFVVKPVA
jgi:biotin carboxyl carrier protein